jgi:O-antigen/teichoic acid export membrane protein
VTGVPDSEQRGTLTRQPSTEDSRNESLPEKMDRNWSELLQELRVTQTGVQLLTAFLLSLPFQQRFSSISDEQKVLYLVTVLLSVGATAFVIMPVSLHRAVFRMHDKERLVAIADVTAKIGLALLALAVTGVAVLIFDVAVGDLAAACAGAGTFVVFAVLWLVIPLLARRQAASRKT